MISGLAPGNAAPTNAAGNWMDGNNCCLSEGSTYPPNPATTSAIRATRLRLARLIRVRNDITGSPDGRSSGTRQGARPEDRDDAHRQTRRPPQPALSLG